MVQGTRGRHPHRDLSTWSRQLPSGIPPPARPHTPPMFPPWALSKISTGLGCLVQIAGHMAWGVQILHTGVGCPNLSSHGRGPHGRGSLSKTFSTWTGSPNLPHGRGALPKSSLTWTFWAATPWRHHHVQQPAPLAHYATCPPTPSIMASHVPSPNHVTHLLPRECEATYPGGVTEGRVRAFTIELGLLRASQCSKWIPPVLV